MPGRQLLSARGYASGPEESQACRKVTPRKGPRSEKAAYLAATGGAGAPLSKRILKAEVVAYTDLGPEAIRRLEVKDFPALVINDTHGGDLYKEGKEKYRRQS